MTIVRATVMIELPGSMIGAATVMIELPESMIGAARAMFFISG